MFRPIKPRGFKLNILKSSKLYYSILIVFHHVLEHRYEFEFSEGLVPVLVFADFGDAFHLLRVFADGNNHDPIDFELV